VRRLSATSRSAGLGLALADRQRLARDLDRLGPVLIGEREREHVVAARNFELERAIDFAETRQRLAQVRLGLARPQQAPVGVADRELDLGLDVGRLREREIEVARDALVHVEQTHVAAHALRRGRSQEILHDAAHERGLLALPFGALELAQPRDRKTGRGRADERRDRKRFAPARDVAPQHIKRPVRPRFERFAAFVARQVALEGFGRAVALARIGREALGDDGVELAIDRRREAGGRSWRAGGHALDPLREIVAAIVRQAAGERLVQRGAQRVHVGARVDLVHRSAQLLRRRVGKRSEELARSGDAQALRVDRCGERDAEIEHQRRAARVDQDVRGLEIAVDHAALVRMSDGRRDAAEHGDDGGDVGLYFSRPLVERTAVDELHRVPRRSADDSAVVQRHQVRMVEPREQLDFALEALALARSAVARQELERDLATCGELFGAIDDSLSAAAKLCDAPIAAREAAPIPAIVRPCAGAQLPRAGAQFGDQLAIGLRELERRATRRAPLEMGRIASAAARPRELVDLVRVPAARHGRDSRSRSGWRSAGHCPDTTLTRTSETLRR
jgi:hypothetical protein